MKGYHWFFIFLRIMVISQVVLIFFKKQTDSSDTYIILDAISKASVGLFLFIFFLVNHFFLHQLSELELGDVLILQFAGILLLVDIDYKNVLKVIRKRFPKFLDTIYRS
jgi:Flp pilus assembly protein TadB